MMKVGRTCCGLLLGFSSIACQIYYHTPAETGMRDGDVVMEPNVKDSLKKPPRSDGMVPMEPDTEVDASPPEPEPVDEEEHSADAAAPIDVVDASRSDDSPTPVDASAPVDASDSGKRCRGYRNKTVLFLNFDEVKLKSGEADDASANISAIAKKGVTIKPPSLTSAQRQKVVDVVKQRYRRFNVSVVTERPAKSPYTMILFPNSLAQLGYEDADPAGIAKLDCANFNDENIGFVFVKSLDEAEGVSDAWLPILVGDAVAHEAGHTFGLVHVQTMGDVMFSSLEFNSNRSFRNMEMTTLGMACRGGNEQNDFVTLTAILGDTTGCVPE